MTLDEKLFEYFTNYPEKTSFNTTQDALWCIGNRYVRNFGAHNTRELNELHYAITGELLTADE